MAQNRKGRFGTPLQRWRKANDGAEMIGKRTRFSLVRRHEPDALALSRV